MIKLLEKPDLTVTLKHAIEDHGLFGVLKAVISAARAAKKPRVTVASVDALNDHLRHDIGIAPQDHLRITQIDRFPRL